MATTKISAQDRKAMQSHTMGCWWTSRAYPKDSPTWSGIANELFSLAKDAEDHRGDILEARELSRLAHLATQISLTDY